MRDRVNASIDSKLKRLYEDMFGKNEWSKILEEATRNKILESGKIEGIKEVIRIVNEEQEERRKLLMRIEEQTKELMSEEEKKIDAGLERRAEEYFLKFEKSLRTRYNRRTLTWRWLADKIDFPDAEKAKAWFLERIKKT